MAITRQELSRKDISYAEFKILNTLNFLELKGLGAYASSNLILLRSNDYGKKVLDALDSLVSKSWVEEKLVSGSLLNPRDPSKKSVRVRGYRIVPRGEKVISEVYHDEALLFGFSFLTLQRDGTKQTNIPGFDEEAQRTLSAVNAKLERISRDQ